MNDQQQQQAAQQPPVAPPTQEVIDKFNASVDSSILAVFELNKSLMEEKNVVPSAVVLANALAASDLVAAIIVDTGGDADAANKLLDNLLKDMKRRVEPALQYFGELAAQRKAAAVAQEAIDTAKAA